MATGSPPTERLPSGFCRVCGALHTAGRRRWCSDACRRELRQVEALPALARAMIGRARSANQREHLLRLGARLAELVERRTS